MSISFHPPALQDRSAAFAAANRSGALENDAAFANLYLLRNKYGTELAFCGEWMLRRYQKGNRSGCFGFPLGGSENFREIIDSLRREAEMQNMPFRFTLLTKRQCEQLESEFPGCFSFEPMPEYTEYLYRRDALAELRGSRYHGKRNHISQFWRAWPDACIQPLIAENAEYAVKIAERWLLSRNNPADYSLQFEFSCIQEAAACWEALALHGLLLYADEKPVGMSIVSEISEGVWDVHFEKVIPEQPHAWPVVVNETAKCLNSVEYLNREEDLGEDGMRSSKQSYHPDLLNEKYTAQWCRKETV